MWYFAWFLGVLLACSVGIINVLWYEMEQHQSNVADDQQSNQHTADTTSETDFQHG